MIWRRTLIELFASPPRRSAWFFSRSATSLGLEGQKAKRNNIARSKTSEPQDWDAEICRMIDATCASPDFSLPPLPRFLPSRRSSSKIIRSYPHQGEIPPVIPPVNPPENCKVQKAVKSIFHSVVTVTLSTAKGEKKYGGIIVDPLGYVIISAEDFDSQKREDLSKFKVDVHLNPGMPFKYTLSGEVSYVDLVNKFAIVKCKSEKLLKAAKFSEHGHDSGLFLYVSTTCGLNNSLRKSLVADLIGPSSVESHCPFPIRIVKRRIFSPKTEPAELLGLAIINLDGELVGLVNDQVNLCATPAIVISKVLEILKEFGTCQPWIGLDLLPMKELLPAEEKNYYYSACHRCQVRRVIPKSPADESGGFNIGDEIVGVDNSYIWSFVELYNKLLLTLGRRVEMRLQTATAFGNAINVIHIIPQVKGQARTPFI